MTGAEWYARQPRQTTIVFANGNVGIAWKGGAILLPGSKIETCTHTHRKKRAAAACSSEMANRLNRQAHA